MLKKQFDDKTIQDVWEKGIIFSNWDSSKYRKDKCGAPITKDQYGNIDHIEGWEIDHIVPESNGGSDNLSNLRPLQWENNRAKSDNSDSYWTCVVKE